MPVAVVALAAGSFAAGATALAAAGSLAATIAAGAVMVGSALTIVGTVTGNEKLAKIGAIIGIVGGIGTALTSLASAGAEAASTTVSDAASNVAEKAATDTAANVAGDVASSGAQSFPVDLADNAVTKIADSGGGMLDAATASAAPAAQPASTGMLGAAQAPATTNPLLQAGADPTSTFNAANTVTGQSAGNPFAPNVNTTNAFDPGVQANLNASLQKMPSFNVGPADPSMLSQVGTWAKENPELAKVALSAGGAAMGNLVPSERDKAMMAMYAQQTAASKQQVSDAQRRARWGSGRI